GAVTTRPGFCTRRAGRPRRVSGLTGSGAAGENSPRRARRAQRKENEGIMKQGFKLLFSLCALCALRGETLSAEKPNVVIVLTDDQGYGDLSCHGNPVLKTPNLDRLHAEGVRFTDFHVSPTCAPTRSALLPGRPDSNNAVP